VCVDSVKIGVEDQNCKRGQYLGGWVVIYFVRGTKSPDRDTYEAKTAIKP
jgi:hypothetical protein